MKLYSYLKILLTTVDIFTSKKYIKFILMSVSFILCESKKYSTIAIKK